MRTKLISSSTKVDSKCNFLNIDRDIEKYVYECPCGKGRIEENHDNTPGFRDHTVWLLCDECRKKYKFNTKNGIRNWELVEKKPDEPEQLYAF